MNGFDSIKLNPIERNTLYGRFDQLRVFFSRQTVYLSM